MQRHRVPTARYRVCGDADEALAAIRSGEFGDTLVVKADGLAAGKGVVVAADAERGGSARCARRWSIARSAMPARASCSRSGSTGPEVSFFVIADGEHAVPLVAAQDHKRIFDDDRGPNTGGMGAFAPSPLVDDAMSAANHARDRPARCSTGLIVEGLALSWCVVLRPDAHDARARK